MIRDHYADPILDFLICREVDIDNRDNSSELTNYQVDLDLSDYIDQQEMRFIDENLQIIDYWEEDSDITWIKVSKIVGDAIHAVRMLHGDIESTSDADTTLDLSDNFENWIEYTGNPLITGTTLSTPGVIKVGSTYYLYYAAGTNIELATSSDGKNFTKITDGIGGTAKVLEKGGAADWDGTHVATPRVIYHNSTYYMFYTGRSGGAAPTYECQGVATSSDGKNFTKYGSNPILSYGGSGWRARHLCHEAIAWDSDNSKWIMLVSGMDGSGYETIGRYYCTDANFPYTWTEDAANPVINYGTQSGVDDQHVYHPSIYPEKVDGKWYIYYTSAAGPGDTNRAISRATAIDLYTGSFTKDSNNPILPQDNINPTIQYQVDGKYALYYVTESFNTVDLYLAEQIDSISLSGWTERPSYTGAAVVSNPDGTGSVMKVGPTGNQEIKSDHSFSKPYAVEAKIRLSDTSDGGIFGILDDWYAVGSYRIIIDGGYPTTSKWGYRINTGSWTDIGESFSANTWYKIKFLRNNNYVDIYADGILLLSVSNSDSHGIFIFKGSNAKTLWVSDFFVRKYSSPEPTAVIV